MPSQFEVQRHSFENSRLRDRPAQALRAGEVRLRVDFFAFTANNLSYAAAGDMLGYWKFFPADHDAGTSWGVIPVWGFADVVEVAADAPADGVTVGDRLYGYFPPAQEVVIKPLKVKPGSLFDGAEHRASLPPLYNRYVRVPPASNESAGQEIGQALLGPLYNTSFCLFDQLQQNAFYDAEQIVIVSASSKTGIGVAYGFTEIFTESHGEEQAERGVLPRVLGLTSAQNVSFVKELAIYDETIAYDELLKLPQRPTVVVDMAGNSELVARLEEHLGDKLGYYISVGLTHWDQNDGGFADASERRETFFAPSYMLQRSGELPPGEFARRAQTYTSRAVAASLGWLDLKTLKGLDALSDVYPTVCAGKLPPAQGLICKV